MAEEKKSEMPWIPPQEFQGTFDEESLSIVLEEIEDWAGNLDDSNVGELAADIVQLGMELAWFSGLNAAETVCDGVAAFAHKYLDVDEHEGVALRIHRCYD
jgi:hypothetical protein